MKRGIRGNIIVALASSLIAVHTQAAPVPGQHANIHATNFLEGLRLVVTNRLAAATNDNQLQEHRALVIAASMLNLNTRTLASDVRLLGQVATLLNTRIKDDEELRQAESDVLTNYSNEARSQIAVLALVLGTNSYPRGSSNDVQQAVALLDRADDGSKPPVLRARWIALALDKLRVANGKILPRHSSPTALPGKHITLREDATGGDQTIYNCQVNQDSSRHYEASNPLEYGDWDYAKTGPKTAALTLHPEVPGGMPLHQMVLTFQTIRSGTFSGQNAAGDSITGTFEVSN